MKVEIVYWPARASLFCPSCTSDRVVLIFSSSDEWIDDVIRAAEQNRIQLVNYSTLQGAIWQCKNCYDCGSLSLVTCS